MARMHTKKHGKSKSFKPMPAEAKAPEGLDRAKIEHAVETYAKQGMSPAVIGMHLKNDHGIKYIKHDMGKRLNAILEDRNVKHDIPTDMLDLMKKAVNLHKHIERNRQDKHNGTSLKRTEAKITRLSKYYMREGKLPHGWRYDPKTAELIIKGR
jgi:small subunit ribosomal protein S15